MVLLPLVEGHATKPSWSILFLLWPSHVLLKTVCSPLAPKPGFPPSAPDNLFFQPAAAVQGSINSNGKYRYNINKSKASCGGDSVHLDLVQVEPILFLHVLKQEPGNIFLSIFFNYYLNIPAYSIYKELENCKHPQSTRFTLSFCILRFYVCLHYNKSK